MTLKDLLENTESGIKMIILGYNFEIIAQGNSRTLLDDLLDTEEVNASIYTVNNDTIVVVTD